MTELTTSPELGPEAGLGVYLNLITDIVSSGALEKSNNKDFDDFSNKALGILEKASSKKVSKFTIKEREVLPRDHIRRGEHPGVWANFELEDGTSIVINIHGGIRDPRSYKEYKDTMHSIQTNFSHTERSNDLSDKKTQFNLHIRDRNGKLVDIWVDKVPNQNFQLRVMQIRTSTNDFETMQGHGVDFVSFRNNQPTPYYSAFQGELSSALNTFLTALK